MKKANIKVLLITFLIQAIVLSVFILLHIYFTLPLVELEGFDMLAQPGDKIMLQARASLNPPGWKNVITEDLEVHFDHISLPVKLSVNTQAGGLAEAAYTLPADLRHSAVFSLSLVHDKPFAYHRDNAFVRVESVSKAAHIMICDLSTTLLDSDWSQIDQHDPSSWRINNESVHALTLFASGSLRKIIYFCPGKALRTTEAREYLSGHFRSMNRLPEGPILFPEILCAREGAGDLTRYFSSLKSRWPYIKAVITNQPHIIQACATAQIPVITFTKDNITTPSSSKDLHLAGSWQAVHDLVKP